MAGIQNWLRLLILCQVKRLPSDEGEYLQYSVTSSSVPAYAQPHYYCNLIHSEQRADSHSLVGAPPSKRFQREPRPVECLTLFPSTCSSITDTTSQVVLVDLQDPQLGQYRLDPSAYDFYRLARLYTMYWDKGNRCLRNHKPFIHFPPDVFPDDELYCFRQYSYLEHRIDAFRKHHKDIITSKGSGLLPGLALIGTPGIGELVTFHLFI